MHLFAKIAASVMATAVVLGLSCSAKAASLAGRSNSGIPGIQLPDLTGPYQVGTVSYDLIDSGRDEILTPDPTDKRELLAQIWYPSLAAPGATPAPYFQEAVARAIAQQNGLPPDAADILSSIGTHAIPAAVVATDQSSYPVVFLSHEGTGLRELYTTQAEELASHGYIVVGISHTYEAGVTAFPDGRVVPLDPKVRNSLFSSDPIEFQQAYNQYVGIRAADVRFVLDQLERFNVNDPNGLLSGHLDLTKVGIYGHSLGGGTATETMRLDSRFKAGIALDGGATDEGFATGIGQPLMLLHQVLSDDSLLKSLLEKRGSDAYNLSVQDAGHENFSDLPLLLSLFQNYLPPDFFARQQIGTIDPRRAQEIINAYNLAFFDKYLKGKDSPLLKGASPNYPEVQFEFYPAPGDRTKVPEPSFIAGLMVLGAAGLLLKPKRSLSA